MAKQDYPPLLISGIHTLTMSELENLAVKPFPMDLRRATLFDSFTKWQDSLRALGIAGKLWVDGSFLTEKFNPSDIDCYSLNLSMARTLTTLEMQQLDKLLSNKDAKAFYGLDFYLDQATTPEEVFNKEAYWKGVFGFQHDRISVKGFVELTL